MDCALDREKASLCVSAAGDQTDDLCESFPVVRWRQCPYRQEFQHFKSLHLIFSINDRVLDFYRMMGICGVDSFFGSA